MYSSGTGRKAPARLFLAHAMIILERSWGSSLSSIAHEATPMMRPMGSSRNAVLAEVGLIPSSLATTLQKAASATLWGRAPPSAPGWGGSPRSGTLLLVKDYASLARA